MASHVYDCMYEISKRSAATCTLLQTSYLGGLGEQFSEFGVAGYPLDSMAGTAEWHFVNDRLRMHVHTFGKTVTDEMTK